MRKVQATPLVYIDRSVMILEPPSLATLAGARQVLVLRFIVVDRGGEIIGSKGKRTIRAGEGG